MRVVFSQLIDESAQGKICNSMRIFMYTGGLLGISKRFSMYLAVF